ncbi:putative glycosyltransferase [Sulfuricella denitrificans skB26]|uniref:Putative glycosyltransferase n=1 Tax=Sulfuricella denitrificans (strain DSM 22764 / NBRC 105220 / skB26) TaxID=1163617 RepID=S6AIW5_SULDS|nr:putative glycosyltransferase [Sulfuricella denitrificans skB26]
MPFHAFPPEVAAEAVCAVVVAYFPDDGFVERLKTLIPQVGKLVVVDNTPTQGCAQQIMALGESDGRIHLIENHRNAGVAAALNQGLEHALQIGCKWLLTLDQDTWCYPDMVTSLLQVHEACKPKAAVIGGNYFDAQNHQLKVPADGETECLEQKTVITSGSLVDVGVARAVGGFREDYFIDQVDHEFCLRVRAHGYRVVISRKPVMEHSVGRPGGAWLPLLGILPNHPPLRKYYIARNTVVTVVEYWRREPDWCLRRSVRLLLGLLLMSTLEKQRLAKVRAFAAGFMDGVRRRMGPCWRE